MHRRLLSAAATAALLLGLAACGETTEGPVTTSPPDLGVEAPSDGGGETPTSSDGGETEAPTAEVPDIPAPDPADYAGMDEHTPEGAEQAARYYVAVTTWGFQTGELEIHDSLISDDCSACIDVRERIATYRERGEYWSEVTIEDVSIFHDRSAPEYEITVGYGMEISPHTEPNPEGEGQVSVGLIHQAFGIGLDWEVDHWAISGLDVETELIES